MARSGKTEEAVDFVLLEICSQHGCRVPPLQLQADALHQVGGGPRFSCNFGEIASDSGDVFFGLCAPGSEGYEAHGLEVVVGRDGCERRPLCRPWWHTSKDIYRETRVIV